MLLKDARITQIIFLGLFLLLGVSTRDWTIQSNLILVVMSSCLITQWILSSVVEYSKLREEDSFTNLSSKLNILITPKVLTSLRSALITSLGLCLLLRSNNPQTMAIAGCFAISSKFLFRHHNKHFFNPANFGIIAALTLTNDAWVSPGQWGTDWWYILLFLGLGGVVLKQVGRWDTSIAFLLSYGGLEAARNFWLGWSWDVWQHQFMSGSLLLFALFMLTDPRSIPNSIKGRWIWSMAIAFSTFILQHYFYLSTAIFWSLFIVSPMTMLLDMVWNAPRFNWKAVQWTIDN
ncbi:RnfABCDGE type electron transport complex subunit D [Waterburya agarophytonicola K14]|uniref:RnfABCDGE type electron transport complex subunit D n=1 Tax=Waterburya agarophytonicola KI4 TaxID=2874699 RepID=A0A964FKB8_9CYAN|nr:RnfABCDGE type electron transport complex subunit D [Waterburya agarophytonicola]MCC0178663.1 RnfABCDGE type electron transport complex subunit D [Waterburya agarophytonicola KI4]